VPGTRQGPQERISAGAAAAEEEEAELTLTLVYHQTAGQTPNSTLKY